MPPITVSSGEPGVPPGNGWGATQAAAGCCEPNCGCGNLSCCTGCGFFGGAEVAFLKPYFNNNQALSRYTVTPATESVSDFACDYAASPRIWLGCMNSCGFGARVCYWEYDQSTNARTGVQSDTNVFYFAPGITIGSLETDNPGDLLATSERLHMYTVDVEITQCMQICCWDVVFGGGIRDASVHIDRMNAFTPAGGAAPSEVADIGNNFDGIGPTVFAELRRPFGCGGLAFVGNVRGSLL